MPRPTWEQQGDIHDIALTIAYSYLGARGFGSDDRAAIISDAMLGVWKAWSSYDPAKGASLKTYAWLRGRGELLDGVRRRGSLTRRELEDGLATSDLPLWRRVPYSVEYLKEVGATSDVDPRDHCAEVDGAEWIEQMLDLLPVRERLALRWRFVELRTLGEIGDELNMTESGALYVIRRGVKRLREHLEGETA